MKKHLSILLYVILAISIAINIVVLCISLTSKNNSHKNNVPNLSSEEIRRQKAETMVRKLVCDNLYYPDSYDPVSITIDSVFFTYLVDADCINAAIALIELRSAYGLAESSYKNSDWTIRFHGNPSGPFLEQERNARSSAAAKMKDLGAKIEKQQSIIKNRDTTYDGRFIGWQVKHRYRASNSSGEVSFGDVLFVLSPTMDKCYYTFSLEEYDNKNLKAIRAVIENELGISAND